MAGKVVDVTLRLIDKMSAPLNTLGGKLAQSATQWTKAGRQIQNAGKAISNVGSTLTTSLTVPIVGMGAACVQSFGEVDKTMRLVESTMGDVKWASGDMEAAIKKAASSSVFSMQEATEATLNFARQGFDAKEAADMLTPSLNLAAGTSTDLSEVTSGLGNTLKVFADQGLTAEQAANIFAKAQAQANTTTTELFEAMSVGSSIFKTVGWSMQDLAAITDVFGDNFISGSEGATAMRTGLARLTAPSKEGASWMKKLNLELVNSDGTMKSMVDVQNQLHTAFAGLTQEQQMQAASAMFGKNQMGKWLTLINTAPDTLQNYRTSLDDTTETAKEMADALTSGVGGSIEKLKSTFDVFKYTVGSSLGEVAQKWIDKITSIMDAFNNLDESTRKTIIKIAAVAAAIGPALLVFGKTVTVVGKVVSAVGAVGRAFRTFTSLAGIISSPAGIVIGVLALVALAAYAIYKNWDKLKPTFEKIKASFMDLVEQIKPTIQEVLPKAIEFLKKALDGFVKFVGDMIPIVIPIISKAFKTVAALIKASMPTIKDIATTVMYVGKKVIKLVGQILQTVMPIIKQVFSTFKKSMPAIKDLVVNAFTLMQPAIRAVIRIWSQIAKTSIKVLCKAFEAVAPVLKKLGKVFEVVFPALLYVVNDVIGRLKGVIKTVAPAFKVAFSMAENIAKGLGNTISDIFSGIKKYLNGVIDFVTGVFTGNWKKAWEGVKGILVGIFSTFGSVVKAPINAIINAVNGAIRGMNKISVPDWVPGVGGRSLNMPTIPTLAVGTDNWKGGIVQISERGGEIVDLPQGSRVYPHDKSVQQAYKDGAKSAKGGSLSLTIPKLADQIIVREEADIDRIVTKLANKLELASQNLGGGEIGYTY